jgi:hypothetical protein
MTIEIINYKKYEKGSLLGFVDFYIPKMGIEVYGSSIHHKNGGKWLNLPSKEYKDKETQETKWSSVVRFREKDHMTAFTKAVLAAVDKYAMEHSSNQGSGDQDDGVPF